MDKKDEVKDVLCPYCHRKLNNGYEPGKIDLIANYGVSLSATKEKGKKAETENPEETDIMEIFDYDPESYTCPFCGKFLGKNDYDLDELFG